MGHAFGMHNIQYIVPRTDIICVTFGRQNILYVTYVSLYTLMSPSSLGHT